MGKIWEGMKGGAVLWFQKLAPEDYVIFFEKLLRIVFVYIVARIIIRIGSRFINRFFNRRKKTKFSMDDKKAATLKALSKSILRYLTYFIAVASILPEFGIRAESIIATAGIGGLAIGFGAQNLVKDVITGFFILFEDQYAVGDFVTIGDVTGTVEDIGLRITKIRGFQGDLTIIPNGKVEQVTNFTRGNALAIVDVSIAYEADIEKAMDVLNILSKSYGEENGDIVETPQVLGVTQLGDSGITLRMVVKTQPMKHWSVERELRLLVKQALDKNGIEIAYPRMVVIEGNNKKGGDRA